MINKLTLRDFQKHKRRAVVFSPGITTIAGSTDAGKSALLRALRWALLNDKPNANFIRDGAKFARVIALVSGLKVTRRQGKGRNVYRMNGKVYKSFGTGVPEPIARALQLSEINFQGQHDAPFWFSLSAPEVSRRLNAVIDLSVIDEALQKVSASVRSASERKRISEENVERVEQELEQLELQMERVNEFKKLQKEKDEIEQLNYDTDKLCSLVERLAENRDTNDEQKINEASALLQIGKRALALEIECLEFAGHLRETETAEERLAGAERYAQEMHEQFEKELRGKNCPICKRPL